jgi:hypothetical protein
MTPAPEHVLIDRCITTVNDLALITVDAVAMVRALQHFDFDEARFRCESITNRAWSHNLSRVGNPAMELALRLRGVEHPDDGFYAAALSNLLREIDAINSDLRGPR